MPEKKKTYRVAIYDTETTWLYSAKQTDLSKQPYVVQFAGILVDMDDEWNFVELRRINQLIKPPISIPPITSEIHWIYDIDVINKKSFSSYSELISKWISYPDVIVWHNIQFDENVVRTEFKRLALEWTVIWYEPKRSICTMNESINYCKLPKKSVKAKWFKRPKLQELVKKTCWHYFRWWHDAIVDVEWTLKALSVLVKNKVVTLEDNSLTLF
jgi:DNA polymerase III epsilon subunit-like protein